MSRILFYAINGIGLGHVARLSVIARAVRAAVPDVELRYHSNCVAAPEFFPCDGTVDVVGGSDQVKYRQLCHSFESAIDLHQPDVLVCDTHWPEGALAARRKQGLRTVLVLRKPDIAHAATILRLAMAEFDLVLLPHSPAQIADWMRADDATCDLITGPSVVLVGPVARVSTTVSRSPVLFSLGGGGDYANPIVTVAELADRLSWVARGLCGRNIVSQFIQGPLMATPVPTGPWDVIQTLNASRYISDQTVVVARPGYNTCWETIAKGARLILVAGQSGFQEDSAERASWLERAGFARRAEIDTLTDVVVSELERGWDGADIMMRARVNAGLPDAVRRIVALAGA